MRVLTFLSFFYGHSQALHCMAQDGHAYVVSRRSSRASSGASYFKGVWFGVVLFDIVLYCLYPAFSARTSRLLSLSDVRQRAAQRCIGGYPAASSNLLYFERETETGVTVLRDTIERFESCTRFFPSRSVVLC
jgi:hypothetical protein